MPPAHGHYQAVFGHMQPQSALISLHKCAYGCISFRIEPSEWLLIGGLGLVNPPWHGDELLAPGRK